MNKYEARQLRDLAAEVWVIGETYPSSSFAAYSRWRSAQPPIPNTYLGQGIQRAEDRSLISSRFSIHSDWSYRVHPLRSVPRGTE